MARLIDIPTFQDPRGTLCVIEKLLPFDIKRVYFMYDVASIRGGHRHKKTLQGLICVKGSCEIYINNGKTETTITLNSPNQCLLLEIDDWHTMDNFSTDAVLLVLASEYYSVEDYIDEPW